MVKIYSIQFLTKNIRSHNNHILIYSTRRGLSSCILPRFVLHETEFRVVSLPRNGSERNSDSLFLVLFHGTEFRDVSLPRKGSEPNSKSMLLFLFHGTEFRVVFSFVEGFGTDFQEVSVPRNSRNSIGNDHLLRLFRLPQNYFFVGNSQPYFRGEGGWFATERGRRRGGGGSQDQMPNDKQAVNCIHYPTIPYQSGFPNKITYCMQWITQKERIRRYSHSCCHVFSAMCLTVWVWGRVSTEVTFWHSAEYGSDFRCNSGEIPRNSAEFRGISPELRRNHFRSQKIPRNSESAEFRGHPSLGYSNLATLTSENKTLILWNHEG